MDNYIFIIIAIALSIIGAVNKSKKKKQAETGPEPVGKRQQSVFDQFFDDSLFNEQTEIIPQPEPQPQRERVEAKTEMQQKKPLMREPLKPPGLQQIAREPLKPSGLLKMAKENKTTGLKRKIQTSFVEEGPKEELPRGTIMENFSLRKAFVYSEIIKRKY